MKTIILIIIIAIITVYSLKSVIKSFSGEAKCSSCSTKKTCKKRINFKK